MTGRHKAARVASIRGILVLSTQRLYLTPYPCVRVGLARLKRNWLYFGRSCQTRLGHLVRRREWFHTCRSSNCDRLGRLPS